MGASDNSLAVVRLACAMAIGFFSCGWASRASFSTQSMANSSSSHGGGRVMTKTAFSTKMRLVFIFGLEGTGHHYIMEASDRIFQERKDEPQIQKMGLKRKNYFLTIAMRESAAGFGHARKNARREMRDLARRSEGISFPANVQFLNGHSVPSGIGSQKVMEYADPRLMAEAAEAEGVDFRVLYLKRSAKEILMANTVHREFQNNLSNPHDTNKQKKFMEYVRVLFTDAAVVQSFLAELDPAFVICHDWNLFGDPDQAQKIADAIAPNADVASLVIEGLMGAASEGPRHKLKERNPFDDADVLSSRIQQKFDSFEELYCGPEPH